MFFIQSASLMVPERSPVNLKVNKAKNVSVTFSSKDSFVIVGEKEGRKAKRQLARQAHKENPPSNIPSRDPTPPKDSKYYAENRDKYAQQGGKPVAKK